VTKLLRLARPHFLLAGISLFLIGAFWAVLNGAPLSLSRLILGYLIIFPGHLSISFSNDYFDMAVDSFGAPTLFSGGSGILVKYPYLREPARRIAIALILCSLAMGILYLLEFSASLWFLGYVLTGDLLGWFYAAPPLRLSYRKLGEVTNVLASGLLIPGLGYLVMRGYIDTNGLLFVIPLMLYGLAFIISVEIPDLEMDLHGHKSTLVSRLGRRVGFVLVGLSLILASAFFFCLPWLVSHSYPLDFRFLGLLSLLPLAAGIIGAIKQPLERQMATRFVNGTIISIAIFFILTDGYLIVLAKR
jgi:1,4-dihydroxy-2-naphthoate polyprenyltransferase